MQNFIKVFFKSFNTSFFVSMVVLSSYVNNLTSKIPVEKMKMFTHFYIPLFNAVISSVIVLFLTKKFIKKKYIPKFQEKNLKEVFFTSFIAGYVTIFTGIYELFMFLITVFIIYVTTHNIKRFIKEIKHLMRPNVIANSKDLGEFFSFFINLIITFTVLNYSLFIAHTVLKVSPAFNFTIGIKGIIDSLYFTIITMTTVGYGDFSPLTPLGRIAIIFESLISYVMFALVIGIVSRGVNFKSEDNKEN